ncbi:hypothetical protein RB195_010273 [Necator americanus]|uniref:EF-hand domain-containing protein n=1 Tax=Necator americanus TaxID=51031 RepID=A0ABR1CZL6_NECAM
MSVEKDNMFWKALMEHKVPKKKLKKKNAKLSNAKELALKYHVSKDDVEKIYKIFVSMDDDGSGTITAGEVAEMLCGFGCDVSPKVVQAVMRSSDKSGDGEIDFEEFLTAVTSKIKLNDCKADIHAMFEKFDRDKDGLLSAEELVVAWSETLKTRITIKEAAALIQQVAGKKFAFASAETKSTYNSVCVARSTGDFNQEKRPRRKLRCQLQQDRDNEWASTAMEFEKAWEDKNPRKTYALLKQCSGKMKRCSPVLNTANGVAVGEATLPIWREYFKILLNRHGPSAPELEHVHRSTYAFNEEPPTESEVLVCI